MVESIMKRPSYCWRLSDKKTIKLFPSKNARVAFRKAAHNNTSRGLSISKEAFRRLHQLSIEICDGTDYKPKSREVLLDDNLYLKFYTNQVKMTRYCMTRDKKQCDGSFFLFDNDEWVNFLDIIMDIMREMNR